MFKLFLGIALLLLAALAYFTLYNPMSAPPPQSQKKQGKLVDPIIKEVPAKKPADIYTEQERKELNQLFE